MRLDTDPFRTPPPTKPELELLPAEPTTVDDLVVSAQSIDPLGESVDYVFEWWRAEEDQDEEKQDDLDSDRVISRRTRRNETWRVRVTPITGVSERQGAPAEASVTIANTPPTVRSVGFSTYEPRPDDTVEGFPEIDDADHDPVSLGYQWLLNDSPLEGQTLARLNLDAHPSLAPGDELRLRVVARDPNEGLEYTSGAIVVQPDEPAWRPLLPDRNASEWWSFWDPLHRRALIAVGLPGGEGMFWEFAVERVTGESRFVPLPAANITAVEVDRLRHVYPAYDAVGKRAVFVYVKADDFPLITTAVQAIDLSERSRPTIVPLETEGPLPSPRAFQNLVFDQEANRIWMLGGFSVTGAPLDEVWTLELGEGTPRWRETTEVLPRPGGGATVVPIPEEKRAFLFGGTDAFGLGTGHSRVTEIAFGEGEASFTEHVPLPAAVRNAFGVFVPDERDPAQDRIYVGAGVQGQDRPIDAIWIYDPRTSQASVEVPGLTEFPRFLDSTTARVAAYDEVAGRIIIEEATAEIDVSSPERGFWSFRPEGQAWEALARYGVDLPPALAHATAVGSELWGGARRSGEPAEDQGWGWNAFRRTLVRLDPGRETIGPKAGTGTANDFVLGGARGWPSIALISDPELWHWKSGDWALQTLAEGSPSLPARYGMAVFRCGARVYYFGGAGVEVENDTGVLLCTGADICTHETYPPSGPSPSTRVFPAAAREAGLRHAVLHGGTEGGDELWRFDCTLPESPTWEQLFLDGVAPSPRYGHTMTPVGGTLVVIGGDLSTPHTDAWLLRSDGDGPSSWEELAVTGTAPPPRRHHAILSAEAQTLLVHGGQRSALRAYADLWELRIPPSVSADPE